MKYFILLLLLLSSFSLSACGTFQGLQKDFVINRDKLIEAKENWNKEPQQTAQNAGYQAINSPQPVHSHMGDVVSNNCPPVYIDQNLGRVSEFTDMTRPSPQSEISYIELKSTNQQCSLDGDFLNMRIDLNFEGRLGPQGRMKSNDRPFFAYPYFIAVTDSMRVELAKEIFAASVSYEENQNSILLVETIRQRLPLNPDGSVPAYNVNVGFQLTEDQLIYNSSR